MKKYVEITLDDKVYKLRYDFQALRIIEKETGIKIQEALSNIKDDPLMLVIFVYAGLCWDSDITLDNVGHCIDGNNLAYVSDKVNEAFVMCFPEAQERKNLESKIGTGENIERLG
ncbi:MAG: hypothetical protein GX869_07565 [Candidatus Cloacimonetes bacterium]|nr:hypothetical protein [Candidatus Cloacimonadota bacterium]